MNKASLARMLENLSQASFEVVADLVAVFQDYDDAMAWKTKSEAAIKTKSMGSAPGKPPVAALSMELEKEVALVIRQGRKNLHQIKENLARIMEESP